MHRALLRRIRWLVGFVIVGLVGSGATALALPQEVVALHRRALAWHAPAFAAAWFARVEHGLLRTDAAYPFIAYGTDWLAFGHFVIAIFMIGAWRDPVCNLWLFRAGQIACLLVIPTALICGALRGIPWWWRAIDSSFGIVGFIPLWLAERIALVSSRPSERESAPVL